MKGAATVIAAPDGRCAINPTGNPGMAKGGSGDVLAGMAGAFLAQGLAPFETAVLAVYLHGMAGDLCAEKFGQRAMLPTDLIQASAGSVPVLSAGKAVRKKTNRKIVSAGNAGNLFV